MSRAPNPQQQAAIEARGRVFVAAGAGTGKTTVLVERFTRAVLDDGVDVESLLVITYTEKAAGELRSRIRQRFVELGRPELTRALDAAWISTIHGFCRRLLSAYPLEAEIDPRFRVLTEPQAGVLQGEAFTEALRAFCGADEPERWQLLATYGADKLRSMLASVFATLRSAGLPLVLEPGEIEPIDQAIDELVAAARAITVDPKATVLQRSGADEALEILAVRPSLERLAALGSLRLHRSERTGEFNATCEQVAAIALELLASRDRELLQELLSLFAAHYAAAKEREAALDFEDLQLRVRDLLARDSHVRSLESQRFRAIMVDEFQDTNRLQTEILDLLTDGSDVDLFSVGDEFQSIYGFRHADVAVFRERSRAAQISLPLTLNYRSRPEVLAAVNELFRVTFGNDFQPLEPAAGYGSPLLGRAFELLVTDKRAVTDDQWRRSEARHVARRVKELVDAGSASPGEIVLLFAAGTDAELYELELEAAGLPTYRTAGSNYYGQQQVVDLLSYLRLLHNRFDDEALLTVLTSPFVGISNDALVLIRANAVRQPLYRAVERSLPDELSGDDRRLLLAFRQRYERLVAASARCGLQELCERILVEHDYDLAVLARRDGSRRYVNLRKLARLAGAYEELRGSELEGFVRFVAEQEAVGARETDAVSQEEGADAVRLMTIHSAKGLEFKVVIVADTGRQRPAPADILCLSDGRFGFKVAHPETGARVDTASYRDVRSSREQADRDERLRLYYVAMTRAMERLIVSGSVDPEKGGGEQTPIAWVLDRLGLTEMINDAPEAPVEVERGAAAVVLRVDRGQPAIAAPPHVPSVPEDVVVGETGQLALFEGSGESLPPPAPRLRELPVIPAPSIHRVGRLSYSAISLFSRCSYRYFAERVVGMKPAPWAAGGSGGALHATEIGDAAHRLLELVDLDRPAVPAQADELVRGWYPAVGDDELARIRRAVEAYCDSGLAGKLAALGGAVAERPFAFELGGALLNGRLDVLRLVDREALVLDYKTNALNGASPTEVVEREYRIQRVVYALACLHAGAKSVEVVYQFLEAPDDLVAATYTLTDRAVLERELGAEIERIAAGDFRPSPSEFACSGCPARNVICAGPSLGETAPWDDRDLLTRSEGE
ncbi:MAG: UvrD-helicase domain-containing protein [Gaiellales bacterium]